MTPPYRPDDCRCHADDFRQGGVACNACCDAALCVSCEEVMVADEGECCPECAAERDELAAGLAEDRRVGDWYEQTERLLSKEAS